MALAPGTGMTKPKMKAALRHAKEGSINIAMGTGTNPSLALLLLSHKGTARGLETDLRKKFPDVVNPRFGTASINVDDDRKLLRVTLNRAVSGAARKLIKTLKGTGITKVVLVTGDGSVLDKFEEVDDTPEAPDVDDALDEADDATGDTADGTTEPARAAAETVEAAAGTDDAPSAPPPPAPPPAPAAADKAAVAKALEKKLAALAGRIAAAAGDDPLRRGELLKLAQGANTQMKTGNLTYAANALAQLEKALTAPAPAAAAPADEATAPAELQKARAIWVGVRQQVQSEVQKLQDALTAAYDGQPYSGEILSRFTATVAPVLAGFDTKVEDALQGLMDADPAARDTRLAAAKAAVKECATFAGKDSVITDLDANPFVPLKIRNSALVALSAVNKAMQ